jgi:hypothetical protein
MGGKGVSKGMGVGRSRRERIKDSADIPGSKPSTSAIVEKRGAWGAFNKETCPSNPEVALEHLAAPLVNGNEAFLRSLTEGSDRPSGQIKIINIKTTELRNPESGGIEQFKDGSIPQGNRICIIDRPVQHGGEICLADNLGKARRGARGRESSSGIRSDNSSGS